MAQCILSYKGVNSKNLSYSPHEGSASQVHHINFIHFPPAAVDRWSFASHFNQWPEPQNKTEE